MLQLQRRPLAPEAGLLDRYRLHFIPISFCFFAFSATPRANSLSAWNGRTSLRHPVHLGATSRSLIAVRGRRSIRQGNLITVRNALEFIAEYDPRTVARIQTAVRRIIIADLYQCRGEYRREYAAALVNVDLVRNGADTEVALVIVHEATHAYLHLLGFAYEENRRQQIERICRRSEMAFLRKVPGNKARIEWLRERFADVPLTDSEYQVHSRLQVLHRLERLEAPKVVIAFFRYLNERANRKLSPPR